MSRTSYPLVADPSAPTIANLTVTYGTDDPGTTPDSTVSIADGDAVAGLAELADEVESKINEILTVMRNAGLIQPA